MSAFLLALTLTFHPPYSALCNILGAFGIYVQVCYDRHPPIHF